MTRRILDALFTRFFWYRRRRNEFWFLYAQNNEPFDAWSYPEWHTEPPRHCETVLAVEFRGADLTDAYGRFLAWQRV